MKCFSKCLILANTAAGFLPKVVIAIHFKSDYQTYTFPLKKGIIYQDIERVKHYRVLFVSIVFLALALKMLYEIIQTSKEIIIFMFRSGFLW